jgi:2',3'-cyclic-nucleotide 2'-phosphodiesterase
MRLLFLGDVVGAPGVAMIVSRLAGLRASEQIDVVVANGENATNGSGLMPRDYKKLRAAGVDAITLGDHIYRKFEIADILKDPREPIVKPANYPDAAPGRGSCVISVNWVSVVVISVMGRTYMRSVDCPFTAMDKLLATIQKPANIFVDFHAEATADKYQMFHHLKGRVTGLFGTHTHVPTADEQVRGGTAYITDVGMCGPHDGVLGRRADRVLHTVTTFEPSAFDVATGDVRLNGVIVDFDESTGIASAIRRVCVSE